jgi:hypothetical protein
MKSPPNHPRPPPNKPQRQHFKLELELQCIVFTWRRGSPLFYATPPKHSKLLYTPIHDADPRHGWLRRCPPIQRKCLKQDGWFENRRTTVTPDTVGNRR